MGEHFRHFIKTLFWQEGLCLSSWSPRGSGVEGGMFSRAPGCPASTTDVAASGKSGVWAWWRVCPAGPSVGVRSEHPRCWRGPAPCSLGSHPSYRPSLPQVCEDGVPPALRGTRMWPLPSGPGSPWPAASVIGWQRARTSCVWAGNPGWELLPGPGRAEPADGWLPSALLVEAGALWT